MPNGSEQPTAYGEGDLTYEDYLRVKDLLSLQHPQSEPPHHDEMLFIIIHQSYELWFKLLLHEIDTATQHLHEGNKLQARHFTNRVVEIMDLLTRQIHILETMDPVDFLQFRDRLAPASGFQSIQFRQLEYALGLKDESYLEFFDDESTKRLKQRLEQPSLRDAYYGMLAQRDNEIPPKTAAPSQDEDPDEAILHTLQELYEDPSSQHPLYLLTESLVSLDQQFGLWREHHVRVVERIIGHKRGTGGSSGVEYLKKTTTKRLFPHLWNIRTYLEGDRVNDA